MRSGPLRAVRLLVVLMPGVRRVRRVCRAGIVPVGVPVHGGAESSGRLDERVLEVAQPLGREIEGCHVRA
ncbi:hypothetical protein [Streptomyces sp. NPDC096012]|uniref:hypothetical protein n=1 Tax=Streptomyces sp. NPDC096012 TaxID=3155684 RepID=UPI00336AE57A